jgi:hypothetical protein
MAVRLKYAGIDPSLITVREDVDGSLDEAVSSASHLYALPTYTALIELRTLLADRGLARAYWE